ncbi:MAG: hypothetical protein P4M12_08625 [Gammaproteobacteria bacterium]|nr:hypothetical protein [Gammaproteobacteria bacterium]
MKSRVTRVISVQSSHTSATYEVTPTDTKPQLSGFARFFCCSSKPNNKAVNPVPDTTRLLNLTDESSFLVARADKNSRGNYRATICYVSEKAETLLKTSSLIEKDISVLIPDVKKNHSLLMTNFFKEIADTGVNPSPYISKHISRALEALLPDGNKIKLNFILHHTVKPVITSGTKKISVIYMIASLEPYDKKKEYAATNKLKFD